jgi:arylsulfatase A-like enzyme
LFRFPLALLIVTLIIPATLSSPFGSSAAAADRPNIVFIFSDDHANEAVSAYGGRLKDVAPTRNIDRLAAQGIRFDNCFVTNALCGPSRATIQTGKHSHINGFLENHHVFNGDQQTFPKLLQKAGYQTAVVGKWHLGSNPEGFDYWDVLPGQGTYYKAEFITPKGKTPGKVGDYVTDVVTEKSIDWLKTKRDKSKPFMLMIQHKAPHRFWLPPIKYIKEYSAKVYPEPSTLLDDYQGRRSAAHMQDMTIRLSMDMAVDNKMVPYRMDHMTKEQQKIWVEHFSALREKVLAKKPVSDELVKWKYQRYMADYLACVRALDDNIGVTLDYLKAAGLDKNTVVIYASDQGFFLGEHGWFDKRFMYEESIRTPLIVRWPGVTKPGQVSKALVSNLDFAETFLDIAGVKVPADMQGKSLKPILEGNTPADWRTSHYYHYYCFPEYHAVRRHDGVRTQQFKLIHYYDLQEWELFDLKKDPRELRSLHRDPAYAKTMKDMKAELTKLRTHYKVTPAPKLRTGKTLFPPLEEFGTFLIE